MSVMHHAAQRSSAAVWRWRESEWAWIAAVSSSLCLLFSVWPQIDLEISRQFIGADGTFIGNRQPALLALYHLVSWLGRSAALLALVVALRRARRPDSSHRWRRRIVALGLTLLVGVGAAVNLGLKENWGRARPVAVLPPGGTASFEPALRPSAGCSRNCSFVSGHAATGFALMSLGMFGAPATRRRWWAVGAVSGCTIGLGRVAQGGHFASDVLFAGVVVWACHATIRQAWLGLRIRQARARRLRSS